MPLHPLVVHAAVVFVPLAAVLAVVLAVPRWRWAARWPALAVAVLATASTQLAALTGENLEETTGRSPLIETHQEWADKLLFSMYVLGAVMLVAFVVLPYVTRISGATDGPGRLAVLEKPLMVLLPLLAVAVLVLVVLTGDAGARSVWQR